MRNPANSVPAAATFRRPEPTFDLERNSADAIAPAMTSSALLAHPWPNLPAPSQEGTALRMLALNRSGGTNLGPTASRRDHLCRFGLSGEEPLPSTSTRGPGLFHVEQKNTPIILWMSSGKYYILYFTPIPSNQEGYRGRFPRL